MELPLYQCHKKVRALKIGEIKVNKDGSALITPDDESFKPFETREGWAKRYEPAKVIDAEGEETNKDDLGYFVQYEGGYTSWSPTKEFEEGHVEVFPSR